MMETRVMGDTGLEVSVVGYGSAQVGATAADRDNATRLLNLALDRGVTLIDTAACYPGSEEAIGRAIGRRRKEFILVSKCGHHDVLPDGSMRSREVTVDNVDQALRRLGTDCIDVMLLHSYDRDLLEQGAAVASLVKAREAGKIRFVGYSGDNETAAIAAAMPEISVVETSINVCDQANIENVVSVARRHGVGVIAKRPIANAVWRFLGKLPADYSRHLDTYVERLRRMAVAPAALGIEGDAGTAWSELALRFVLSVEGVHTAIVGTTNSANLKANVETGARGRLPEGIFGRLREAFLHAQAEAGEMWTGQN